MKLSRCLWSLLSVVCCAFVANASFAQSAKPVTPLALYEGADRQSRLQLGARQENALTMT